MKSSVIILMMLLVLILTEKSYAAGKIANEPKRPKIGLVLSGGGALGLAHVGVLQVLDEMRVPVDCVVGTSMGALVGGAYAAGVSPQKMQKILSATDIFSLFNDEPPRVDIAQQVKRDDYQPLFNFSLGFNDAEIQLPAGASAGYKFELFLKKLIGSGASISDSDFDKLPTPYRAVATDLESGEMKVFSRGDLPKVMRASMSLPAIIAPIEINDHIYVDGGLVRNLPVDIGRELCGDIIIAVNLGTTPKTRDQLRSSIDVAKQSIVILTEQNVQVSLLELTSEDILITPKLQEFDSTSFSEVQAIINKGLDAGEASKERLSKLALTQQEYHDWLTRRQNKIPEPIKINRIETAASGYVNPAAIKRDLKVKPGEEFDFDMLNKDIAEMYGRGDFSYVGYSTILEKNSTTLVVKADSKPWGPGYLRLGLGAATDFTSPAQLNLAASYQRTWINQLGAEWRTDAQIGYNSFLRTEFMQPLQVRDGAFISPYIGYNREHVQFYNQEIRLGEFVVNRSRTGVDIGLTGYEGELRIGPYLSHINSKPDFGAITPVIPEQTVNQRGIILSGVYDQLDSLSFPGSGTYAALEVLDTREQWGSDDTYTRANIVLKGVKSFGKNTFAAQLEWGDELSGKDELPVYDAFKLGGPMRLSGLYLDQLTGSKYNLATLTYYRQYDTLPAQLGRGLYLGVSAGAGRINDPFMEEPWNWVTTGSIFWGAETILGAAYIGFGFSSLNQSTWYLKIGPRF